MKSVVNQPQSVKTFPKLMVSKMSNAVVFFYDDFKGIVVSDARNEYGIGHHSTDWIMDNFKDFNGSITLSND